MQLLCLGDIAFPKKHFPKKEFALPGGIIPSAEVKIFLIGNYQLATRLIRFPEAVDLDCYPNPLR